MKGVPLCTFQVCRPHMTNCPRERPAGQGATVSGTQATPSLSSPTEPHSHHKVHRPLGPHRSHKPCFGVASLLPCLSPDSPKAAHKSRNAEKLFAGTQTEPSKEAAPAPHAPSQLSLPGQIWADHPSLGCLVQVGLPDSPEAGSSTSRGLPQRRPRPARPHQRIPTRWGRASRGAPSVAEGDPSGLGDQTASGFEGNDQPRKRDPEAGENPVLRGL